MTGTRPSRSNSYRKCSCGALIRCQRTVTNHIRIGHTVPLKRYRDIDG